MTKYLWKLKTKSKQKYSLKQQTSSHRMERLVVHLGFRETSPILRKGRPRSCG